jgi:uncharacterized membrane protein YqhA
MSRLVEKSRYLAIIGVLGLLVAAVAAFLWGVYTTGDTILMMFSHAGNTAGITVALVEIVDAFLIATTLLIFTASLYELFIADIDVPEWMIAHNLHELKAKLSSMIVLVLGVKFLEKLLEVKDAQELMYTAISIAVVSAVLIAFGHFGGAD